MLRALTRQTLAVVVAVAVVCSFVGAPVAAAAALGDGSDSGLDGLGSDSQTSTDTTDGDATTDDGSDDGTTDDASTDDDPDNDTDNDTDSDDGTTDDASTDDPDNDTDDENSSSDRSLGGDDTDADEDRERRTDRVRDAVNETGDAVANATEGIEDTSVEALDFGEDAVGETVDQVVTYADLEEALGLDVLGVGTLESDAGPTGEVYAYDRTVATDHRELPDELSGDTADGSGLEATAASDGGDGDGDGPGPANPAGATIGLGAVATAAALRGSPVVTGSRAARSSGLVSRLLEKVRPFVLPLRYSRYDDSDPLEHEARERVYEIVNETPGSYLSEVSQEADLPLSTTRHHIKVLEREDLVTGAKIHGKRRFYPAYAEGIELSAALNDESTASIIRAIARVGAASVSDLADELGRDPSTISHHLQRLEEDGVITRERDGRAVVNKLSTDARTALEPETAPEPRDRGEIVAGGAD